MTRPSATFDDHPRPRDEGELPPYELATIAYEDLDPDAVRVIEDLESAGFEGYLVGGCVRDLLLGVRPKDFDIATNASPNEVRRLFHRARVIGRRFKLAHVVFPKRDSGSHKIIEVSTFRRSPSGESINDGLIVRDNEFGTLKEDALRRDFSVNSLFYDVNSGEVIDHTGGLEDLENRVLRTIGDPDQRLREDPVRMLRAIKFAARLDLDIANDLWDAILETREALEMSAPPRLLEELIRILSSGSAAKAFELLIDSELIAVLLPDYADHLESAEGDEFDRVERLLARLDIVDNQDRGARRFSASYYLGVLFVGPIVELVQLGHLNGDQLKRAINGWLAPVAVRCRLPKREVSELRDALMAQRNFWGKRRRRGGFSINRFIRGRIYRDAYRLFRISCEAHNEEEALEKWDARVRSATLKPQGGRGRSEGLPLEERPRRTRRNKRRRRRRPAPQNSPDEESSGPNHDGDRGRSS